MTPEDEGYDLRLSVSSLRAAKIVDPKAVATRCPKPERSCAEIIAYFSAEFLHKRGATRAQKLQSRGKRSRRRFPGGLNEELWPPRGGLSHGVIRLSPNPVVVEDRPSGAFVEVVVGCKQVAESTSIDLLIEWDSQSGIVLLITFYASIPF